MKNSAVFHPEATIIMGVLNVTPDSFSDGGNYFSVDKAVKRGMTMLEEGAHVIDVGPESTSYYTHPTKRPVDAEEQIRRAIPVIEALAQEGVKNISVDTTQAKVAKAALEHGATWINDQTAGLQDEAMGSVMAQAEKVVLMHGFGFGFGVDESEGTRYENVMDELCSFFKQRIHALSNEKVQRDRIIIDPGFGFGKGLNDSLSMLSSLHYLQKVGCPILVGPSRKSFIGKVTGIESPKDRDNASLVAFTVAVMHGASLLRVHNVKAAKEAMLLVDAVRRNEMDQKNPS